MARTEHGDADLGELAALGLDRSTVLDLSVNVSPFGPHPAVLQAVRNEAFDAYPDRDAQRARRAIAADQDHDPAGVLVGHGAVELLWSAVFASARDARADAPLLVVGPTFSEPEAAAHARGIPVAHVTASAAQRFALDPTALDAAIAYHAPCAVYLCHPNNPTGYALPAPELQALTARWPATPFLLDQSFLSLSTRHHESRLRFGPNVVLIRSLTKDHALAGLRVGYALCHPDLATRIDAQRPPWTVTSLAQAAIIAALAHPEHVTHARTQLLASRDKLAAHLAALGHEVTPGETPFLLAHVGDATTLRAHLLACHRIAVRNAASFGLPHHIRIAAPAPPDLPRVLAATLSLHQAQR